MNSFLESKSLYHLLRISQFNLNQLGIANRGATTLEQGHRGGLGDVLAGLSDWCEGLFLGGEVTMDLKNLVQCIEVRHGRDLLGTISYPIHEGLLRSKFLRKAITAMLALVCLESCDGRFCLGLVGMGAKVNDLQLFPFRSFLRSVGHRAELAPLMSHAARGLDKLSKLSMSIRP